MQAVTYPGIKDMDCCVESEWVLPLRHIDSCIINLSATEQFCTALHEVHLWESNHRESAAPTSDELPKYYRKCGTCAGYWILHTPIPSFPKLAIQNNYCDELYSAQTGPQEVFPYGTVMNPWGMCVTESQTFFSSSLPTLLSILQHPPISSKSSILANNAHLCLLP